MRLFIFVPFFFRGGGLICLFLVFDFGGGELIALTQRRQYVVRYNVKLTICY